MATQETAIAASSTSSAAPSILGTVQHYRSMLDIEDPPKLNPLNPLSFDELYTAPKQQQRSKYELESSSDSSTEIASGPPGIITDDQVKDLGC